MTDKGVMTVRPQGGALAQPAPEFIKRGNLAEGGENLAQHVSPPLLKIIQKQSDDKMQDAFGKGTTLIRPADIVVAPAGTAFHFVPVMSYTEYVTWAPIEQRGQLPAILDRSLDPRSDIAAKASDPNRRIENGYKFGDKTVDKVRHVEHITFIVVLLNHELGNMPAVMSFSRGEHRQGRNFASLIKMRNADLFGCVFEAKVNPEPRSNQKGTWFGWDITNPSEEGVSPWITDEAQYEGLRKLHVQFEEAYQNDLIRAGYDDTEVEEETTSARDDM